MSDLAAKIRERFPACSLNNCLLAQDSVVFHLSDSEGRTKVHLDEATLRRPFFTIRNPKGVSLDFLAIDKCILFDGDGKKCDCAVFDSDTIRFIEMKDSTSRKRSERRSEAVEQLKASIDFFWTNIDLTKHRLEAYICVGHRRAMPRAAATNQNYVKDLFDNHHGAILYDCSELTI